MSERTLIIVAVVVIQAVAIVAAAIAASNGVSETIVLAIGSLPATVVLQLFTFLKSSQAKAHAIDAAQTSRQNAEHIEIAKESLVKKVDEAAAKAFTNQGEIRQRADSVFQQTEELKSAMNALREKVEKRG
jgi:hypothetical protein